MTHQINPALLSKPWSAFWITSPGISGDEFGVYLFRKRLFLPEKRERFITHVSADNKYKLYVNGKYVCKGSECGYFMKWRFESVDISPYLHSGENIIVALVWNF